MNTRALRKLERALRAASAAHAAAADAVVELLADEGVGPVKVRAPYAPRATGEKLTEAEAADVVRRATGF